MSLGNDDDCSDDAAGPYASIENVVPVYRERASVTLGL
jgi:hypothetical protein